MTQAEISEITPADITSQLSPPEVDASLAALAPDTSVAESKIATGRSKKDIADAAFKEGNVKAALRSYHEALMYLIGLDRTALKALGMAPHPSSDEEKEERTEIDIMQEKIYANMSACHIKQENWKRALETADKALAKNPANTKALFRKGKALGELGYFEKAEAALMEVKKLVPDEASIADAEISRLRAIDRERQKVADQKMRGWLSREKKV